MGETEISIWDKVDYALATTDTSTAPQSGDEEQEAKGLSWKRQRLLFDALATVFWAYVLLKIFFVDVDREVIKAAAPGATWLVDYRFLFFLGIAAVVVATTGAKPVLFGMAYIFFFPMIVIAWKAPRILYKSKSWITFFAVIHVIASLIANFRYAVIATTVAAFSAVFILATNSHTLLATSMVSLAILLLIALVRTLRLSAKPSGFVGIQERALDRIRKSDRLPSIAALDDDLRDNQIQRFNEEQQTQFLTKLQGAVFVQKLSLFWAYQLDEYRRSPAPLLFSALAYAWLVLQTVFILTLVNYALFKVDPTAFEYTSPPSLLTFVRYVLTCLTGGEIAAVQPSSNLADGISIGSTFLGIIFLIGLVVGFIVSFRQKSQDAALIGMINGFKQQSRELDRQLQKEYEVGSVEEAFKRLQDLQAGLLGLITFFSSRIPPGFEDGTDTASPDI